jgi:heptose I phosphotransferase
MSETLWRRLFQGVRRLHQHSGWARFAGPDWADRIMKERVTDRFHAKQGRTIGRWVLQAEDQRLVVYLKRHYHLPWWQGLLALLRPGANWSPALQEWEHLRWAQDQGLPVPHPVAAGEFIGPWGRLQSFLAVEELTGMLPLHEAIPAAAAQLDPGTFVRWKRGLVEEMAAITLALHRRRRFHKDLYLCHFYVAEEDTGRLPSWRGRVQLIDLHRLGHHPWTWPWWQAKDLAQLLYSSEIAGVSDRDRLCFWRAYLGGDRIGRDAGWLRRWAQLRAWRYRRHHRQKAQRKTTNNQRPYCPLLGLS